MEIKALEISADSRDEWVLLRRLAFFTLCGRAHFVVSYFFQRQTELVQEQTELRRERLKTYRELGEFCPCIAMGESSRLSFQLTFALLAFCLSLRAPDFSSSEKLLFMLERS